MAQAYRRVRDVGIDQTRIESHSVMGRSASDGVCESHEYLIHDPCP